MNRHSWIIICLAYIIGLLTTGLFYFSSNNFSGLIALKIGTVLILIGVIAKFVVNLNIENKVWINAILIAFIGVVYFNFRIPQPPPNDLSYLVSEKSELVMVKGKVISEPRLNTNQKVRFWLQAKEVTIKEKNLTQTVSGKVYVTVPLLEGNHIYPRQLVTIEGALYQPIAAISPEQFDFKKYLKAQGAFAGLTGWKIIAKSEKPWGWYQLRTRIIRAQVKGLGSPVGQLVSSMVLGRKAVDLPQDIRDLFIKGGLAHVLAASGFHVSLLLGIILKLTNFLEPQKKLIIGLSTLLIYICLTGFSPSVIRAAIMGVAVLIAVANQAKVRPLGALLLAATIILLINPLWIWDLGFQLSFLATLGLIITLPILETKLDWLPSNLATAIAVPLAASLWALPLISYVFNTVATYSIVINLIATPLITIISLGGMLSSAVSLIMPSLGSSIAWLLKYPTLLLIALTKFFTNLPGSTFAIGEISLFLLLTIYSLIILIWLNKKWQKNWWLILIFIGSLIIIPLRYQQANLSQVTVLATAEQPSVVIQDRGEVILINSGESKTIKYIIMPFLASQGINHLDYVVMPLQPEQNYEQSLATLESQIAIKKLMLYGDRNLFKIANKTTIPVEFNSTIITKSLTLDAVANPSALQLKIDEEQWLLTDRLPSLEIGQFDQEDIVLLWLGKNLNPEILNTFKVKVAIANNFEPSPKTPDKSPQIYTTDRQGTISWTPQTGFSTALEGAKRNNTLW